jgi:hypothetical protein
MTIPSLPSECDVDATALVRRYAEPPDGADLQSATMATLLATCASREADALSNEVLAAIIAYEDANAVRQRARRADDLASLLKTVSAILADLLAGSPQNGRGSLVYRSTHSNAFSGGAVPYRPFMAAYKTLLALGLIERFPGFYLSKKFDWGDGQYSAQGRAPRFRATAQLLAMAHACGITAGATGDHFSWPEQAPAIVLKPKSRRSRGSKVRGRPLVVPDSMQVRELANQVVAIDAFLRGVTITGGTHRAFYRGFEHGDQAGFDWNKGGRLYSSGAGNYQMLPAAGRLAMRFDGQGVVEIDIRASYLTILHGKLGIVPEFGKDPYEVPGIPRDVVKSWLVTTLGAERHLERWPSEPVGAYRKMTGGQLGRDHPVKAVHAALLAKYPVLERVGEAGLGWSDLMYAESEAIIQTMTALMQNGISSLPVHDSLLVPARVEDYAIAALIKSFQEVVGIAPLVKTSR